MESTRQRTLITIGSVTVLFSYDLVAMVYRVQEPPTSPVFSAPAQESAIVDTACVDVARLYWVILKQRLLIRQWLRSQKWGFAPITASGIAAAVQTPNVGWLSHDLLRYLGILQHCLKAPTEIRAPHRDGLSLL